MSDLQGVGESEAILNARVAAEGNGELEGQSSGIIRQSITQYAVGSFQLVSVSLKTCLWIVIMQLTTFCALLNVRVPLIPILQLAGNSHHHTSDLCLFTFRKAWSLAQ